MSSSIFLRISRPLIDCERRLYRLSTTRTELSAFHSGTRAIRVQTRFKYTTENREEIFAQESENDVPNSELTFEWNQLQTAYRSKRIGQILRAIFVLKICSYDTFVLNNMQVSLSRSNSS